MPTPPHDLFSADIGLSQIFPLESNKTEKAGAQKPYCAGDGGSNKIVCISAKQGKPVAHVGRIAYIHGAIAETEVVRIYSIGDKVRTRPVVIMKKVLKWAEICHSASSIAQIYIIQISHWIRCMVIAFEGCIIVNINSSSIIC